MIKQIVLYQVICNNCKLEMWDLLLNESEAKECAKKNGWLVSTETDTTYCKECYLKDLDGNMLIDYSKINKFLHK